MIIVNDIKNLFGDRNYFNIWFAQIISSIGDGIWLIGLPLVAFHISHSEIVIGVVAFCELAPMFFGFFLGALIDRWNKIKILYICDLIRASILLILAILYSFKWLNIPVLCMGAFLLSFQSLLFTPTRMAVMPTLFSKDMLQKASSFLNTFSFTGLIIGKICCGFFISSVSYTSIFIIDGVSFIISACFLMCIRAKQLHLEAEDSTVIDTNNRRHLIREIKDSCGILIQNKQWIWVICFFLTVNLLVAGLLQVMLPIMALERFYYSYSKWFSLMYSGFNAGILIGSFILFLHKNNKNIFSVFFICLIWISVLMVGFSFPLKGFEVLVLFFMGLIIASVDIKSVVYLQKEIPEEYSGRIFSLIYSLVKVAEPISIVIYTSLLFILSPDIVILTIGLALMIVVLCIFAIVSKMRRQDNY